MTDLLTIKEASDWASAYLKKNVTTSNISYLIQYGRIKKYGNNETTSVKKEDLIKYYKSFNGQRENNWKEKLGEIAGMQIVNQYKRPVLNRTKKINRRMLK